MISLSILVPAYNEEATIIELLDRVAAQKIKGVEIEVLVIDDGSSDKTVELLEQNPKLYTKLLSGPGTAARAPPSGPGFRKRRAITKSF